MTGKTETASNDDNKRVILNDQNYPVWSTLTLSVIGTINARTLELDFVPYANEYERPIPPGTLMNKLKKNSVENATNPTKAGNRSDSTDQSKQTEISFDEYEKLEKLWQSEQRHAIADADDMRTTVQAIRNGMSKKMQASYAKFTTPATLWAKLKRTKDPKNRKLDTSAAENYKNLTIRKNQSIPDYLKAIHEVEDAFEALELRMNNLWDGYKRALERNVPEKPSPSANVSINGNGKRPGNRNGSDGNSAKRQYAGKMPKCNKCPGYHQIDWDCKACWNCGSHEHRRQGCPVRPGNGAPKPTPASAVPHAAGGVSANVAIAGDNAPTQIGWRPVDGHPDRVYTVDNEGARATFYDQRARKTLFTANVVENGLKVL
ncbi:UNVERIFIED_CONTAM: hypothetical protein HDU68_004544 [Siphonaria sp. JEL0065]|nr:hypothetical protein HDU68_004544 [Siphonaria sp. JEL0065]